MATAALRSQSLKLRLLLPYIVLILLLTGVIGGLTYFAGARTVSQLSDRMLQEMAARLRQSIEHHVSGSAAVLEAAFPQGMAATPDIRSDWTSLRNRLWAATTLHPQTNDYVYYGNVAGQGVGLKRLPDGGAQLRIRAEDHEHRRYYALDTIDGQLRYLHTERHLFDPRERPWFQLASRVDHHTWTSVYIDFGSKDLILTRARRVLNDQGVFEGVVATDVSLRALNAIVEELATSVQGLAFVVEQTGELVAVSGMRNVRFADAGRIERMTAHTSGNSLVHSIYQQIQHQHQASLDPHAQHPQTFVRTLQLRDADDKPLHAAFVRVIDQAGLDWMAVVAVPRATILAGVSRMVEAVLFIGALSLLLALFIGLRLFGRIADDVRALSKAVKRVGQGDLNTEFQTQRRDEVGELARSFSHMRTELFTDHLTGISNRSALLHALTHMTSKQQGIEPAPFALLFLDLNLFKPLNDRWGHDNGDLALKEVAQRLRQRLRSDDHVARLGGDEFVVVLKGVAHRAHALSTSAQLRALIEEPLTTLQGIPDGECVALGASIGIAMFPEDANDVQTLLKLADQQMYEYKAGHRPAASR